MNTKKQMTFGLAAAIFLTLSSHMMATQSSAVNLSDKGIPVTVDAPTGATISNGIGHGMEMEGIKMYVLEIKSGAFTLEVSMEDDAMWQDLSDYLSDEKESVEEEEDFDSYISSETNGFVFKMNTEDGPDYGFYYMLVKGDRLIEFRTGLAMNEFTQEQVQTMYDAAKSAQ